MNANGNFVTLEEVRDAKKQLLSGWFRFAWKFAIRAFPIAAAVALFILAVVWLSKPYSPPWLYTLVLVIATFGFFIFPAAFFAGHLGLYLLRMRKQLTLLEARIISGERVPHQNSTMASEPTPEGRRGGRN